LQELFKERVAKRNARRSKPLTPQERKQILSETKQELLAAALPDISYSESFWRLDSGVLLLFTTGKKLCEIFEELFYKTFCEPLGLCLVKIDPPLMGLKPEEWLSQDAAKPIVEKLA